MLIMKHELGLPFEKFFLGYSNILSQDNYPPHNIIKNTDELFTVEMAVTGFDKDEIEVTHEGNTLKIVALNGDKEEMVVSEYLYRGLSRRNITKTISLGDHYKVIAAKCRNGILTISIQKEIPEEKKPKQIKIQ